MIEIIPNWHPIFVHFTVALISISAALFVITKVVTNWRLEDQWLATAYWNLWFGALLAIITVAAGWYAFNTVDHDTPSHEAMKIHRDIALGTFALLIVMGIWGVVQYKKEKSPTLLFVIFMAIAAGGVGVTGWHGAELVYKFGLGVQSLPKTDDHAHAPGEEHSKGEGSDAQHGDGGDHHDDAGEGEHSHPADEEKPMAEGGDGNQDASAADDHNDDDGHAH